MVLYVVFYMWLVDCGIVVFSMVINLVDFVDKVGIVCEVMFEDVKIVFDCVKLWIMIFSGWVLVLCYIVDFYE